MTAPPAIATAAAAATLVSGFAWSGATVTYSIPGTFSTWSDYGGTGEPASAEYRPFAPNEAPRFRAAMAVWDALVAISFTETSDIASRSGQIRIAATGTDFWGFAYYPGAGGKAGDIWISRDVLDWSSFATGTYDWQALLHEIGHAIGLKHPFEDSPVLADALDNYRYTIMSYTAPPDAVVTFSAGAGGGISWVTHSPHLTTPGLFDILAIQQIYGADATTRAGATTYRFDSADPTIQVLYDAGGIDTFDLSTQTRRSEVDLRQGAFSSINIHDAAARIEAEVARFGEAHRGTITSVITAPGTYAWHDNVGIAFGTVIENVRLGRGHDIAIGNDAANMLLGGAGNDMLGGGAGNDTLNGGGGADTLDGGAGNDRMVGGGGNDRYVVHGAGDIVVEAAGGGIDTIITWKRVHVLEAEVEVLRAAAAAPVSLQGNGLANILAGGRFADTLAGGEGDDSLYGLGDADRILGGGGRDMLLGDAGRDQLFGGIGDDRLWGQADDDRLHGDAGNDTAFGGDGADTLFGIDGNDALYGDAGADSLLGGAGGDSLFGGAGNDTLLGQAGADTLQGGPGADVFRFVVPAEGGDVIRDFNRAQGDVISVGTNAFRHGAGAGPTPGVNFIGVADPMAPSAEVAFLYDTTTGTLRYDPDGAGGIAPVLLATLAGAPALTAADIIYA